ncbi:hypothetical protein A3B45_00870 [Candidatus Daviesbacteria bacterium RIFCSPLOWO2_01_FULL_39_12]|uniref:Uncharacterized protein n=1 Tax=Candidatus Daviesbacteria bacterium RIFCSPLOWO2_01_FULL_39_12 TaxID=1797785 RepID=A0A1F5KQZ4_9BACT|nr:MAG: hypothetical protein A3D79_03785 [Candidatus Daviesbacteria bacterium RIFCSPHIGHO2_02_FULL_39_8]OGE43260.1 MAG: hypothetical protein A3B45_00870 [Candidatus Daviesbacteria bacterium RIFCSPLOWO2_01_FULL_39_12]
MIRRSPEVIISIPLQESTQWGAVTVVEMLRPDERLVKAVQVPYPALTLKAGIWVPERHGEIRLETGARFHSISWKDVITGGCSHADRTHLQRNKINAGVISLKSDPDEYRRLLYGTGLLLFRR